MVKSPSLEGLMRGDVALGDIINWWPWQYWDNAGLSDPRGFPNPRGSVIPHQPLAPLQPVQVCLLGLSQGIWAVHLVGSGFLEAPAGIGLCQGSSDSWREIQVKVDGTQLPSVCPSAHCIPQLLPQGWISQAPAAAQESSAPLFQLLRVWLNECHHTCSNFAAFNWFAVPEDSLAIRECLRPSRAPLPPLGFTNSADFNS